MPIKEKYDITKPIQFYAATKSANELIAYSYSHLYNMKATALRFLQFTVHGEDLIWLYLNLQNIIEGKPIEVFNHGNHERDFTFVEDCVDAISKITLSKVTREKFEVYNIANGNSEKLISYIKIIEKELGINQKEIFTFASW